MAGMSLTSIQPACTYARQAAETLIRCLCPKVSCRSLPVGFRTMQVSLPPGMPVRDSRPAYGESRFWAHPPKNLATTRGERPCRQTDRGSLSYEVVRPRLVMGWRSGPWNPTEQINAWSQASPLAARWGRWLGHRRESGSHISAFSQDLLARKFH